MNCSKCGAEITKGKKFCKHCGEPAAEPAEDRMVALVPQIPPLLVTQLTSGQKKEPGIPWDQLWGYIAGFGLAVGMPCGLCRFVLANTGYPLNEWFLSYPPAVAGVLLPTALFGGFIIVLLFGTALFYRRVR